MSLFLNWLVLGVCVTLPSASRQENDRAQVDAILRKDYDKDERPHPNDSTSVKIGVYINSLAFDDQQFTVEAYVRSKWVDPRLASRSSGRNTVLLGKKQRDSIWRPGYFVRTSASYNRMGDDQELTKLYSDGTIWNAERVLMKLNCEMHYNAFPVDSQVCRIMFELFSYKMSEVFLTFLGDTPLQFGESFMSAEWTIEDSDLIDCSANYSTGAYPCLTFRITFRRDVGIYLKQHYIPSLILTALLYISFWLKSSAGRGIYLGFLTALLCTLAIVNKISLFQPTVSYATTFDFWLGACFCFLFLAVAEYCIVIQLCSPPDDASTEKKTNRWGRILDIVMKIVFPVLLVLYVIIYFSLLLA